MVHSRKTFVVRVTGFTTNDPEQAEQTLKDVLRTKRRPDELWTLDDTFHPLVIPSCDNSASCDAILDFKNDLLPEFLLGLRKFPLQSITIPVGQPKPYDLIFDCHFHGFTQLHHMRQNAQIDADIIAITGFDGHGYGSWRARKAPWRMWLRDHLPEDLPDSRIMIFGYDSKMTVGDLATTEQYSAEFLQQLKLIRSSVAARQRPIFFIAHSYGGTILTRALVEAHKLEGDAILSAMFKSTHGIQFFGVPHHGIDMSDLVRLMRLRPGHPGGRLLEAMKDRSYLEELKLIVEDRKIMSFVECKRSRKLRFNPCKFKFERTGRPMTRLLPENATLRLPFGREVIFPIHEDHSEIVKLPNKSATYRVILNFLKEGIAEAPEIIKKRFESSKKVLATTMPFPRDKHFVGRVSVLDKLDSFLKEYNRAGIYGLAGIGKSQIAIECAYRMQDRDPKCQLFWIHASSSARFLKGIQDIAAACKIPGRDDSKADILSLTSRWLELPEHGTWFLVIDNFDDEQVLLENRSENDQPAKRLIDFLPKVDHGKILVTSRSRNAAETIAVDNVCEVQIMSDSECLDLSRNRSGMSRFTDEDINNLCGTLDCIPLAIVQACGYLKRSRSVSIAQYIERLQNRPCTLLRKSWDHRLRRDPNVPHAVIDAFIVSFMHINETDGPAAYLLSFMAQFDPRGIPKLLIEVLLELGKQLERESSKKIFEDDVALEEAVSKLEDFSLIRFGDSCGPYDMHPLIQTAVIAWNKGLKIQGTIQDTALWVTASVIPSREYENWETWRILAPHISRILDLQSAPKATGNPKSIWVLLLSSSWFLREIGDYNEAEIRAKFALDLSWDFDPEVKNVVLESLWGLADVYKAQGQLQEAEEIVTKVMGRWLEIEGPNSEKYLRLRADLASIQRQQGRYAEALSLLLDVFKRQAETLGASHSSTLATSSNLATLYSSLDHTAAAEGMLVPLVESYLDVFGPDHPNTLTNMSNLAIVYSHQDRLDEAEDLCLQVLAKRTEVLGPEDPMIVSTMENLATIYDNQGRFEEGERLHLQILEKAVKTLGPEHHNIVLLLTNLACNLKHQDRFEEAEKFETEALELSSRVLGDEHPNTLFAMTHLAETFEIQGLLEEAENLATTAMQASQRTLGADHTQSLSAMSILASTYRSQGRLLEAEELGKEVIERNSTSVGAEHSRTATAMSDLAQTWKAQGRTSDALPLLESCVDIRAKVHGEDHPETRKTRQALIRWKALETTVGAPLITDGRPQDDEDSASGAPRPENRAPEHSGDD